MTSEFIDSHRHGGDTASMTTENKAIVQRALAELITTGDVDALASVLSDDFVHHRPDSTSSTKAEWLAAVRAVPADLHVDVHHMLSDGDHVVMHSCRSLPGAGLEITGVDIWRFDNGLIVEGWEILEQPTQATANLLWWQPAARRSVAAG